MMDIISRSHFPKYQILTNEISTWILEGTNHRRQECSSSCFSWKTSRAFWVNIRISVGFLPYEFKASDLLSTHRLWRLEGWNPSTSRPYSFQDPRKSPPLATSASGGGQCLLVSLVWSSMTPTSASAPWSHSDRLFGLCQFFSWQLALQQGQKTESWAGVSQGTTLGKKTVYV